MKSEWLEKFMGYKGVHRWNTNDGFAVANGVIAIRNIGGECTEEGPTKPEIKNTVARIFEDLSRYDSSRIDVPSMKKLTEMSVMSSYGVRQVELETDHYFGLEYLKDLKRIFPKGNWYTIPCKGRLSPLYVIDDDGNTGVLMPRRP